MTQLRESDDLPRYPEFAASRLALLQFLSALFATSSPFFLSSSGLDILQMILSSVEIRQELAVTHFHEY